MILKDITFSEPEKNIVFDEVLYMMAEKGLIGESLRFWESDIPFIVLGRISKEQDDINRNIVLQRGIKVLRRCTGGGTVLQGKGCLNYSLVLSKETCKEIRDIHRSYQFILTKVIDALLCLNVKAEYYPISDIALVDGKRKISGNAQKRGRRYILHHGTLLYDYNLDLIGQYINMPQNYPDYRDHRNHKEFVANVSVGIHDFKKEIMNQFQCKSEHFSISEREKEFIQNMLDQKHPGVELSV